MKRLLLAFLSILMAVGLFGCVPKASALEATSDKPRDTSPQVSDESLNKLVEGNNAFALDLYRQLGSDGNIFFSPYSLSQALAMAYAGAKGDTAAQMSAVLHFALSQEQLHPAFNRLALDLARRGQGAQGKDGEGFRLQIANATWGQKDYKFLPGYLDTLAVNYGAGLRLVDFINATEQSRQTINQWVSEQTEGKIKDLIPQGSLNNLTRLVLTNAVYFNAAWLQPFDKSLTKQESFNLVDGRSVTVSMMSRSAPFQYYKGNDYQAVELPYDGREMSMVVIVPDEGKFERFAASFGTAELDTMINGLSTRQVMLSLPKFQFDSSFGLKKALSDMGMADAFTGSADFSGIDGKRDLCIQDVLHKAYVSVDEAGTEAAAASAVIVGLTAMPTDTVQMKVDRPFLFLIRDNITGSIIFIGRVLNPATK